MPALLDEAKKVVDTPWYLNKKETSKESLKQVLFSIIAHTIYPY